MLPVFSLEVGTKSMRRLLNILAVIIGVVATLLGAGGAVFFVGAILALLRTTPTFPTDLPGVYILIFSGGASFLGFLIASRALLHLRHPDAGTARDMIGTAIYLIVFCGVLPLFKSSPFLFPLIIGLYFVHRFLVKRVTAQALPLDAGSSQT